MKRIAEELKRVAVSLMPNLSISINKTDEVEPSSFNAVHYEISRYLDTIRRNESLGTIISRMDSDQQMILQIGFTSHEAREAIEKGLVTKMSHICSRYGIKEINSMFADGAGDTKEASALIRLARSLMAGTDFRTIEGQGWTEREALQDALRRDQDEYGHGEGYGGGRASLRRVTKTKMVRKPMKAKRVTLEKKQVRKGPVQKRYVMKLRWGFSDPEMKPAERDRRFQKQYETQTDALKAAKEVCLEYGVSIDIYLEAFCVGDTHLATLNPGKQQIGVWRFECEFRS